MVTLVRNGVGLIIIPKVRPPKGVFALVEIYERFRGSNEIIG